MKIPVLILLGPPGRSEIEYWISLAQRAAALDLIQRLDSVEIIGPVYVYTADEDFAKPLTDAGAVVRGSIAGGFHFGRQLRTCVEEISSDRMIYFGAASAPLLSTTWIQQIADQLIKKDHPWSCVNNLFSTDWAFFNYTSLLAAADQHLPSDNSLGWVARNLCGFHIVSVPSSGASRADLDTPSDLFMMEGHSELGTHLSKFIKSSELSSRKRSTALKTLISTPAKTLALLGRVSSESSRTLERATQIWTRVFSEERGMVASGRLARGEVVSLTGKIMATWGPARFVQELEQLADGALWDTRVVMAQMYGWPSSADRFAFDLGRCDLLQDDALIPWCEAVHNSAISILSGGHSVVSGGLLALLETVYPQFKPEFDLIQIS
ncbi:MAG: hypothetical protein JXA25_03510 [Anaerolineales bacterium]|nr:hypothetical protein [Anaerolineales bacterium]